MPIMPIEDDLTGMIIAAMMSEKVSNHWINKLNESIDKKIAEKIRPLKTDIEKIKTENVDRDNAISRIEVTLDDQEMMKRDKNVIVEGMTGETKEEVAQQLNDLLDLDPQILPSDIENTYKLKPKSDRNNTAKSKTKIIFKEKISKTEVIKAKPNLKGKDVWISDDLTTHRSGVAFAVRQAKRAGKIEKCWVHEGKIFSKKFDVDSLTA